MIAKLVATLTFPVRALFNLVSSTLQTIRNLPKLMKNFEEADPFTQAITVLGGIGMAFVLVLLVALIGTFVTGGDGSVAEAVSVIRDIFIILLAVQGMLVSVALIMLVLQLAATVNLLQNELSEVVNNLKETTNTVKGTSQFLSENISAPVIESQAWLSGVATFVREVRGVWNATQKSSKPEEEKDESNT